MTAPKLLPSSSWPPSEPGTYSRQIEGGWETAYVAQVCPVSAGMWRYATHYVLHVLPGIGEPELTKHEFRAK